MEVRNLFLNKTCLLCTTTAVFGHIIVSFICVGIVQTLIPDSLPNNQIGFGAFVDKPLAPYTSVDPERWVILSIWMQF